MFGAVYLVHREVYAEKYGSYTALVGIFDDLDKALDAAEKVNKTIEDDYFEAHVSRVDLNREYKTSLICPIGDRDQNEIILGGYAE